MFVHLCVFVLCFRPDLAARCISSKDLQALPNDQSPRWSSKFRIPQVETGESWKFYQKGHRRSAWNASEGVSRSQGVRSDRTMRRATTCFVPSCAVMHTTCFSEDQRVRRKAWFTEIHGDSRSSLATKRSKSQGKKGAVAGCTVATWCHVMPGVEDLHCLQLGPGTKATKRRLGDHSSRFAVRGQFLQNTTSEVL